MGSLILLLSMLGAILALAFPWIGIVDGYLSILLGPQVLWWWAFEGTRHFLVIALCTIVGSFLCYFRGMINFYGLKNRQNLYLFIWFFFIILSFLAGPYVDGGPGERYFAPQYIFSIMFKAFLFYFFAVLCINDEKKFKYLCIMIVVAGIYFIYWINDRYLSGYYGFMGRYGGPRGLNSDQYGDENNMAMFFVISLPFLYYYGLTFKNIILKYSLWLIIPFGWHGIFLTGSRGGLLGLAAITCLMVVRSKRKIYSVLVLPAIIIAFYWQGGPVMQERSSTIISSESATVDSSVQGRIDSWAAAARMMFAHPITGVGLSSFGMAYPDFSDADPREAHNTFFQIGAENGVFAMLAYILFLFGTLKALWKNTRTRQSGNNSSVIQSHFIQQMNDAVLTSWVGFIVCAFFLSLQVFEQFFYLAVISNFSISYKKQFEADNYE